jgi:hypothetical protein
MIKTLKDAEKIIDGLNTGEILKLKTCDTQICFTKTGCREFENNEVGEIGEDSKDVIVKTLYKNRKLYNHQYCWEEMIK